MARPSRRCARLKRRPEPPCVTFTYRGLGSVAKHLARALETGDAPSILMLARELSLPELEQKAMRVVGEV